MIIVQQMKLLQGSQLLEEVSIKRSKEEKRLEEAKSKKLRAAQNKFSMVGPLYNKTSTTKMFANFSGFMQSCNVVSLCWFKCTTLVNQQQSQNFFLENLLREICKRFLSWRFFSRYYRGSLCVFVVYT